MKIVPKSSCIKQHMDKECINEMNECGPTHAFVSFADSI